MKDYTDKAKTIMTALVQRADSEKRKPNQLEEDIYYICQNYIMGRSKMKLINLSVGSAFKLAGDDNSPVFVLVRITDGNFIVRDIDKSDEDIELFPLVPIIEVV